MEQEIAESSFDFYLSKDGELCYAKDDGVYLYSVDTNESKKTNPPLDIDIVDMVYDDGKFMVWTADTEKKVEYVEEIRVCSGENQYETIYEDKEHKNRYSKALFRR